MSHSPVVVSNLSFAWPDDTPVFRCLTFDLEADRVGRRPASA
ncbi:hypothetical protein AB0F11_29900 [Streptomyces sp. NPDC032472]